MTDYVTLELDEIMKLIPHRYPFLMVDRVEKLIPGKQGVGIKCVTTNEPYFMGHFPGNPIMPGVMIVEALAQTAGLIVNKSLPATDQTRDVYFMSIDSARFRKPVKPGMVLHLEVEMVKGRGQVWKYRGEAKVDGQVMAEATYTAMIVDSEDA